MKKFLSILGVSVSLFSMAQITLNEGFESGSTPAGFANVSFFPSKVLTPCTGSYGLTRGFWASGKTGSTTYSSTVSNGGKLDLAFKYKTHIYSGGSVNGTLKVEYSADGGQNYTTLETISLTSVISCTTWSGSLAQGLVPAGSDFKFRVSGELISGEYDVILDDFVISQSPFLATSDITKKTVGVYPNPFTTSVFLDNTQDVKSVSVSDVSGRIIKTISIISKEIKLNDLQSGLYIMTINYNDGKSSTSKIVKK